MTPEKQFSLWQRGELNLYIVSYRYYDKKEEGLGGGTDESFFDINLAKTAMEKAMDDAHADYEGAVFESCVKLFDPELEERAKYKDVQDVVESCHYDDYGIIYSRDNHKVRIIAGKPCTDCGCTEYEYNESHKFDRRCKKCGKTADADSLSDSKKSAKVMCYLSRDILADNGYDTSEITDKDIDAVASSMSTQICTKYYATILREACKEVGIPIAGNCPRCKSDNVDLIVEDGPGGEESYFECYNCKHTWVEGDGEYDGE